MENVSYHSPTERMQAWLDASTLHIRFNHPARHNALSVDMWEAIPVLLAQAEVDERVRLVVFSGAGEKASASRRWRASAAIALAAASMSPSAVICASRLAIRCFPFLPRVWAWVTATRR